MSMWYHMSSVGSMLRRRSRMAMRITLVALFGSMWCLAGGVWTLATWRDIEHATGQVTVDVYFESSTPDSVILEARQHLAESPYVAGAWRMQAESVWQQFENELRLSKDSTLRTIVEMPRIVRVLPKANHVSVAHVSDLVTAIRRAGWSTVTDVPWPQSYVAALDRRRADLLVMGTVAGGLSIFLFAVVLLSSLRAEFDRAHADVAIAHLVGAGRSFVAMPHILLAVLCCVVGIALSVGGTAILWQDYVVRWQDWLATVRVDELGVAGASMIAGCIIVVATYGIARSGSVVSLRKRRAH